MLRTPHHGADHTAKKHNSSELTQAGQRSAEQNAGMGQDRQQGRRNETPTETRSTSKLQTIGGFPLPFVVLVVIISLGLLAIVVRAVGIF